MESSTFVLFRPRIFHNAAETFYRDLKQVLENYGYSYLDVFSRGNGRDADPYRSPRFVRMTWHTHGLSKGQWHLCRAPFPDMIEFDQRGYAGFSSVRSKACAHRIDQLDQEESEKIFTLFSRNYLAAGRSKYSQPSRGTSEGLVKPYVFVALQVPGDSVLAFSTLTPYQFCNKVIEKFLGTSYQVVVKQHPRDTVKLEEDAPTEEKPTRDFDGLSKLRKNMATGRCQLRSGNIHELIAGAEGVFTVNSGVGLESLLHRKPVFVWSKSQYDYAATNLPASINQTADDLLEHHPFDLGRTSKLFHYLLSQTFVPLGDRLGAERVIQRVLHYQ